MKNLLSILVAFTIWISLSAQPRTSLIVATVMGANPISEDALAQFERQHSEVDVHFRYVSGDLLFTNPATTSIDDYVSALETYVQQGDVLLVSDTMIAAASIADGYFLDLAPLIQADPSFGNEGDFHPLALTAFQDDTMAVRGLASHVFINSIIYDPAILQAVGLQPPNADWNLSDYRYTAEALNQFNNGTVVQINAPSVLLRGRLNEVYGSQPDFTQPELLDLIKELQSLYAGNLIDTLPSSDEPTAALWFGSIMAVQSDERILASAPLPGETADLSAIGLGVSAGTAYPELAYKLAVDLLSDISTSGGIPTHLDQLTNALTSFNTTEQNLIESTMNSPPPLLNRYFSIYIDEAVRITNTDMLDRLQAQASNLSDALKNSVQTTVLHVRSPELPVNNEGITLRFSLPGMTYNITQNLWRGVLDEFVTTDYEIGAIEIVPIEEIISGGDISLADCIYAGGNMRVNPEMMLNLSPLIDTDPDFYESDLIGGTLAMFTIDDQINALPMTILPSLLQIDREQFENAGIAIPVFGWSIREFDLYLNQLNNSLPDHKHALHLVAPRFFEAPATLMLIAAFGGLPFDYRTDPPTVDFTNPASINAIQSLLGHAKTGSIQYSRHVTDIWRGPRMDNLPAIIPITFGEPFSNDPVEADWVSYPHGSRMTPVSFSPGYGMISNGTFYPEACYRLLNFLRTKPYLFSGLPAYHSLIDAPELASIEGMGVIREYAALLDSPNTLVFPSIVSLQHVFEREFLYAAFDAYLFDDAELDAMLEMAERQVNAFRECVAHHESSSYSELETCKTDITEQ